MYSMNGVKYNNYIVKSFNTDRTLVESYKSEILRKEKYVFLGEFIANLIPTQTIRIECNTLDKTYSFLAPIIEKMNKIMSIQQAFYELMCEAKLMPVNTANSGFYIANRLNLEYITRSGNATSTETDSIDIPLLPSLQYFRVN
ncbi:hypothetical protein [Acetoanaerobium noterae]|uniref:hypothetical protein n=1 Tax=Acetoanaerobium noterae TaxID=745369 RepID=UPI0028B1C3EA|nr:hypothetical protein [Acetoanaerobium noterae]